MSVKSKSKLKSSGERKELSPLVPTNCSVADILDTLEKCKYALDQACRTDKISWLQECALVNAVTMLSRAGRRLDVRQNAALSGVERKP
jgi:hypothetical protein